MHKKLILWFVLGWAFSMVFPPAVILGMFKPKGPSA